MWIAKKPFLKYAKGDEVTEGDAKKYGSLYCTQSSDIPSAPADNIDNAESTKEESETAKTEESGKEQEVTPETNTDSTETIEPEAQDESTKEEKPKTRKRR